MDSHKGSNTHPLKHHQPSSSEILSSAKYLAEAAKSTLHHETDKVDKGRAAEAAADLLDAASHYGKLEEKSFGNYIEKAETYLHQYHSSHSIHSSHSSTTTTTINSGHGHSTTTAHSSSTTAHSSSHSDDNDDSNSGSGYGEYFKMAEGFLKKY